MMMLIYPTCATIQVSRERMCMCVCSLTEVLGVSVSRRCVCFCFSGVFSDAMTPRDDLVNTYSGFKTVVPNTFSCSHDSVFSSFQTVLDCENV